MRPHRPIGWNTWDFRGFNRFTFLRDGRTRVSVMYAIWDEHVPPPAPDSKQIGRLYDTFRWTDVRTLGPHAPLGLPARLEFVVEGVPYRAEADSLGDALKLIVTPLAKSRHQIVIMFVAPVGEALAMRGRTDARFAGFRVRLHEAIWPGRYFLNIAEPYAVGRPGEAMGVEVWPAQDGREPAGTPGNYATSCLHGEGALADAPQAMMQAINWNTLYDTRRGLVSSPVSRDWCYDWRGVLVFCWDTFFVGAMCSLESPELARLNFEAVTAAIDEIGHVPNYYMAHGAVSLDRSMPPLGAYMIWKVQAPQPDLPWLRGMYPRLKKWHRYWMAHRDGNRDGLLEWGTDRDPQYEFPQLLPYNPSLQHTAKCAMYESGLDNSPMYDDVPFNEAANTFELADVGLNSYYAMDCEALAAIADALDRPRDAARYRREYEQVKQRMNESLWDEEHGLYANRYWDGRFSTRWSPTSFFPLIAGVATPERAERMVREHLLNEKEFWGRYVIPSIARNDPAYPDNDYWRGRIWGPFNFLVAEGLRRYRFDDVAADLARRSLEMFLANWRADGGIYENYNAETGQGGDVWNAARLYHWGGLMAHIAIGELVDVEPAGCLRFGSIAFPASGVRNVRIGGDAYDVDLDKGVRVRRNGESWLECAVRAVIRLPLGDPSAAIQVSAAAPGELLIADDRWAHRKVTVNGRTECPPQQGPQGARYRWETG